jgi:Outer membrane protein beta-barrel domain
MHKVMFRIARFLVIALATLCVPLVRAQDQRIFIPSFGIEAGVPLTQMFSTYSITALDYPTTYTPYSFGVPRYQVGAYADFHLTRHFSFEVDGLYRRGEFAFDQPAYQFYEHTVFNSWEFPLLFQYSVTKGRVRPFLDAGASLRHLSGVRTTFFGPGTASLAPENTSDILRNWSTWGGVAGAGVAFKLGRLEFTPQVRYTRWWNQAFGANGLSNSLNESVVMLGVGF